MVLRIKSIKLEKNEKNPKKYLKQDMRNCNKLLRNCNLIVYFLLYNVIIVY